MKLQILKKDGSKGFKFLTGINRDIIPGQVSKLSTSISKMGIIRPVVVAVINFLDEPGTYIIDGQHLFYALMRADMDIPYVSIDIKDKKELVEKIALLNASSKSWAMKDYLTSWSFVSTEYRRLAAIYNVYDLELCFLATVLGDYPASGGGNSAAALRIKRGEFKVINESSKVIFLDCLTDVLEVAPRMGRMENLYLCREYLKFYREAGKVYKHALFLEELKKKKSQLTFVTQESGKLAEMFKKLV